MNRRLMTAGLALGLLVLALLAFTTYRGLASPRAARAAPPVNAVYLPPAQWNLPTEGWSVCRVGGVEMVEGVGERQVFDLCHARGWQLKTYCLDPGMPIPSLGDLCSQVVGGTYWCGDDVQQLGLIDVLQAPETATVPSATAAATNTSTATSTATVTATVAISPTLLQQETLVVYTPTTRSTPYQRPAAGGPGNLEPLLAGLGASGALALAGGAGIARLRRALRRKNR